MSFSPDFERAMTAIANMGLTEPPFDLGQPLRHRNSPDQTHYIPISIIKCGSIWWAECVAEDNPQGHPYSIMCDWLYDPYPELPSRGRLTGTGIFLHVVDGGQA